MATMSREFYKNVVGKSNSFYFLERDVMGYKCEIYNYKNSTYEDFKNNDAFEMRGLTFVYDGMYWKKYFALNKFFNINETSTCEYSELKNQEIMYVQEKLDGSMISFIKFPNGIVRAKSKTSFESEQAIMANKCYESSEYLKRFVDEAMERNLNPIFELTSHLNQIVVKYDETKLTLLHVRDSLGTYFTSDELGEIKQEYGIPVVNVSKYNDLEELINVKNSSTKDIEGYVVTFSSGQMVKIKTNTYIEKHGIISDIRENEIIRLIIDDKIDDVVSLLTINSEKRRYVESLITLICTHYLDVLEEILTISRMMVGKTRKEMVFLIRDSKWFHIVMKTHGMELSDLDYNVDEFVKTFIKKSTNKLSDAKNYISELSKS